MIKNLICWLWGHRIVFKDYTGKVIDGGRWHEDRVEFIWRRLDFCIRCGKKVED